MKKESMKNSIFSKFNLLLDKNKWSTHFIYCAIWVLREMLNVFDILPINNNRILFYSFNGKQYSDNPKYISDVLCKNNKFDIYWAFKNPDQIEELPKGIKTVKFRSLSYYLVAKTSKIVVFNVQGFGELSRRKNQIFIQTWHASNGYKKIGNYKGIRQKLFLLGHRDYSYVMSGAESMTERRIRRSMGFKGEVLSGTPRMDKFINAKSEDIPLRVQKTFNISKDNKLLLYAPTWRRNRSIDDYEIDYKRLHDTLKEKFGGDWIIAIRLHPNIKKRININLPYIVDATEYPEMTDLLYTADVLISDYSSCIWDYSFTYRPCFLYCYDLDEYCSEMSFDIPIEKWRFPIATNMDDLIKHINEYDSIEFRRQMDFHHKEMGSLEDGYATERVCNLINHIANI